NSKFNNLRSGVYAKELVVRGERAEDLQRRCDVWTVQLGAVTEPEQYEVLNAVHSSWRHDRLRRLGTVALNERIDTTIDGFGARKAKEVADLVERLPEAPAEVIHQLRMSTAGLNWMLSEVGFLSSRLELDSYFDVSARVRAIHLCGKRPVDLFDDPAVWFWDRLHLAFIADDETPWSELAVKTLAAEQPQNMSPADFERRLELLAANLPNREEAHARLLQKLTAMSAELTERLELIGLKEERELAAAVEKAKFDAERGGDKRRRAEESLDRMRRSSYKELRAHQKARREGGLDTDALPPDPYTGPSTEPAHDPGVEPETDNDTTRETGSDVTTAPASDVNITTTVSAGSGEETSKCKYEPTCQNGSESGDACEN